MQGGQPRLGVTQRLVNAVGYHEPRDALARNWSDWIGQVAPDLLWMPLPNLGPDTIVRFCSRWQINRLLLTGGDNPGDDPARDATEHALLDWAYDKKIPTLGVCRGMQVMAVWAGGELVPVDGHVARRHTVDGREVNSFHALAVRAGVPGFKVEARAEDGTVEAISCWNAPMHGVMWHPEREPSACTEDSEMFARCMQL